MLDFLVINAGYNPHINFSFNIHPKSQKNYKSILNNLAAQKVNVIKDEIYTFFIYITLSIIMMIFFLTHMRSIADM